jgi:hypothetical protein
MNDAAVIEARNSSYPVGQSDRRRLPKPKIDAAVALIIQQKLTDAMVSIEGENMRQVAWSWSRRWRAATGALAATP